jgi:D-alanyl-D-alanine carboxypeptidase (penicillin-binding protein 5/6)
VAVAGVGLVAASRDERRVPIASLTKMMTALVILRDHPLAPGEAGPTITIAPRDVEEWAREARAGDSVVEVRAGEVLTEYQALEALLVPSADNIADRLADWDAGSAGAFVDKMNALSDTFRLGATHYADPSGLDGRSASTAADQAYIAAYLMSYPVIRSIVRSQRINLPVVGVVPNRNPALGVDGIIGVKGGYTSEAENCLVTAAYRMQHTALVIAVTLGQPEPLDPAHIDEAILHAVTKSLERRRLVAADATHATAERGLGIRLLPPDASPTLLVWPGLVLRVALTHQTDGRGRQDGSGRGRVSVAVLTVSTPWGEHASLPRPAGASPG